MFLLFQTQSSSANKKKQFYNHGTSTREEKQTVLLLLKLVPPPQRDLPLIPHSVSFLCVACRGIAFISSMEGGGGGLCEGDWSGANTNDSKKEMSSLLIHIP